MAALIDLIGLLAIVTTAFAIWKLAFGHNPEKKKLDQEYRDFINPRAPEQQKENTDAKTSD